MSVHDVGRYGYDRQHTGFKALAIRGYRAGCILDWLESVAGWGKQTRTICPCTSCATEGIELSTPITKDWRQIALDFQTSHDVSCFADRCDGVKERVA